MTDWRAMMHGSPSPGQYPQNPQRGSGRPHSEDFEQAPNHPKTVIEPAIRSDGRPLSPIFWETGTGQILGPAVPEYLGRDGNTFWIVTTFEGQIRWINADRLRSKRQFETQKPLREVDLIREAR